MPASAARTYEFQLPVWNALYQVRDFSQYVTRVSAGTESGKPAPVKQVDKTTWQVEAPPGPLVFEYDVFCDNAGPFGAQANSEHAFLNLAMVLVYPVGLRDRRITLRLADLPQGWRIATALPSEQGGIFTAVNYDQLVDSPIEIGTFQQTDFEEGGARYAVVVHADPADYDARRLTQIAGKLAAAEVEWMQDRPFDRYVFIYHFPRGPAGGGMEHAYSTAIDAPAQRVKEDPQSIANVTAHEFFHLWNVKRIRPQSLEPVDYTKEQYTRVLWFSEGVTSTVADYMLVRAGLRDEKRFLADLAGAVRELESRPAHLTQSVEESSLNAWLEKYPQYVRPERSISYYNKGELLGILLDLSLREATGGRKSLRDVFQWLNRHYARQRRFFPDTAGVKEAVEALSAQDWDKFFDDYVAGVKPLPYEVFGTVGLRLEKRKRVVAETGFRVARGTVTGVVSGTPAEAAGLRAGDLLQEVDGKPVSGRVDSVLRDLRPGETIRLKVSGAGGVREITFVLGRREEDDYALVDLDKVTPAQRARRAVWMRGDPQ